MSDQHSEAPSAPYVYHPVDAGATHERGELAAPDAPATTAPAPAGPEQHTVPSTAEGEEH